MAKSDLTVISERIHKLQMSLYSKESGEKDGFNLSLALGMGRAQDIVHDHIMNNYKEDYRKQYEMD